MRQMVAYERLKTMENYKAVKEKVIALAYGRWSITRSSNYRALGEKILVNILVRWSLMVPYKRWSLMESGLFRLKH